MMNVSGSGSEILMAILPVLLAVLLLVRLVLARTSSGKKPMTAEEKGWGTAQTGGSREIQADRVEVIKTNHSIQDAAALAIFSPVGTVLHTGD